MSWQYIWGKQQYYYSRFLSVWKSGRGLAGSLPQGLSQSRCNQCAKRNCNHLSAQLGRDQFPCCLGTWWWQDAVLTGCWTEGASLSHWLCPESSALSSLPHGPFHRVAHNMAACFIKIGKQEHLEREIKTEGQTDRGRLKQRERERESTRSSKTDICQSFVIILEVTSYLFCYILFNRSE